MPFANKSKSLLFNALGLKESGLFSLSQITEDFDLIKKIKKINKKNKVKYLKNLKNYVVKEKPQIIFTNFS